MKEKYRDVSPWEITFKTATIITTVELIVMVVLFVIGINKIPIIASILIDIIAVSITASAALFYWVVSPMKMYQERLRAKKLLIEQSKVLEAFFKHTITPLALLDKNFIFIRVNDAYAKADGRDISEFPGRNHFEFYPSDTKSIFENVVNTKSPFYTSARPFKYFGHPELGITYWDWS